MGVFDSTYLTVKCPVCGQDKEREIQFRGSIGKYKPSFQQVKLGEYLNGFPKIPYYEVEGRIHFSCECRRVCEKWEDCWDSSVLIFAGGCLRKIIYPLPNNWEWIELQKGKRTQRKVLAQEESCKRFRLKYKDLSEDEYICKVMAEPLKIRLDYADIACRLMDPRKYPNYYKDMSGKWKRRKI